MKPLLNTDLSRELDHMGRFLSLVVEYKHKIGFRRHDPDRAQRRRSRPNISMITMSRRFTASSSVTVWKTR